MTYSVCLLLTVTDAYSKKVRVCTKLNDMYLHLPESLLEAKPLPSTAASALSSIAPVPQLQLAADGADESTLGGGDVVHGGHAVPPAPGAHFEPAHFATIVAL